MSSLALQDMLLPDLPIGSLEELGKVMPLLEVGLLRGLLSCVVCPHHSVFQQLYLNR